MSNEQPHPSADARAQATAGAIELRNFRWAYSLLVALAIRKLEDANRMVEPGDWPNGMEWDDMTGSSRGVFLRLAREEAGIDHDEFLEYIRAGMGDEVEDIYERKYTATAAPSDVGGGEGNTRP